MARIFRLLAKKRGRRRTISRLVGSMGEAIFFGTLFFLGVVSLAALVTDRVLNVTPVLIAPGFGFWVMMVVAASFVLFGGGGVVYTVMHVGTSVERRSAIARQASKIEFVGEPQSSRESLPGIPAIDNFMNSPGVTLAFRLPVSQSVAGRLFATMILFLILTAVTSILTAITVEEHLLGRPDWFLTLFVSVLVLLDVWVTRLFLTQLWQHTRIGPTCVEIAHHPLRPGERCAIVLSQHGRIVFEGLRVALACEEEATYRQGTDIRTEFRTVHQQLIFSRGRIRIEPGVPFQLQESFDIPPFAMHSFQSGHNSVRWRLIVRAEPERWPAIVRSFPVLVYPTHTAKKGPGDFLSAASDHDRTVA